MSVGKSDPGMLIAPLSRQASEATEAPSDMVEARSDDVLGVLEEEQQEHKNEEGETGMDLLELKEEGGASTTEDAVEEPKEFSAMDLLSELDFGSLHVGSSSEPAAQSSNTVDAAYTTNQSGSYSGTYSNPIPDAFVLHAAGDVYGKKFTAAETHRRVAEAHKNVASPSGSMSGSLQSHGGSNVSHPWNVPRKESTASTGPFSPSTAQPPVVQMPVSWSGGQSSQSQPPSSGNPFADL